MRNVCISLQHMGQGANAAIFDAAALGTLFADVPDASAAQMARRLRVYDEVRAPLVSATQLWSEVPLFGQPGKKNDEVRLVLPGVDLPGESHALLPPPLPTCLLTFSILSCLEHHVACFFYLVMLSRVLICRRNRTGHPQVHTGI